MEVKADHESAVNDRSAGATLGQNGQVRRRRQKGENLKKGTKKKTTVEVYKVLKDLDRKRKLTPENVFNEGKSPTSPLHKYFQWDRDKAAYEYNMMQARDLITSFKFEVHVYRREFDLSEFVPNPKTRAERKQGYVSLATLKTRKKQALEFMEQELAQLFGILCRVRGYAEELGLVKKIEPLEREYKALRSEIARNLPQ